MPRCLRLGTRPPFFSTLHSARLTFPGFSRASESVQDRCETANSPGWNHWPRTLGDDYAALLHDCVGQDYMQIQGFRKAAQMEDNANSLPSQRVTESHVPRCSPPRSGHSESSDSSSSENGGRPVLSSKTLKVNQSGVPSQAALGRPNVPQFGGKGYPALYSEKLMKELNGAVPSAEFLKKLRRKSVDRTIKNDSVIGDYRIIGTGQDTRAVHVPSNQVFKAEVLDVYETLNITRVIFRLDNADNYYMGSDADELKERVFPSCSEVLPHGYDRYVLFTPIETETLHDYAMDRGDRISEDDVKEIFEQLMRILAFCHSIGLIVRDIKPRSIHVFGDNRKIRLSNVFSFVVLDDPKIDTIYERFVSPAYVPPEVLNVTVKGDHMGYSGKKADMWASGILVYLLLLGQYPFFDKTPVGVFYQIRRARVTIPASHISFHARQLIHMILKKNPDLRPNAADFLWAPYWPNPSKLPCRMARFDINNTVAVAMALPLLRARFNEVVRTALQAENNRDDMQNVLVPTEATLSRSSRETLQQRRHLTLSPLATRARVLHFVRGTPAERTEEEARQARRRRLEPAEIAEELVKRQRLADTASLPSTHLASIVDACYDMVRDSNEHYAHLATPNN